METMSSSLRLILTLFNIVKDKKKSYSKSVAYGETAEKKQKRNKTNQ